MRFLKFPPLLICILFFSSCFTRDVRVVLNNDGAGHLEIITDLSEAFLRYAERHAGLPPDRIWFHEQALRHGANVYGDRVHYVEHSIEDSAIGKRFRVRYAFDDIATLNLQITLNAPFLFRPPAFSPGEPPSFRFAHEPGHLRVFTPNLPTPSSASTHVRVESAQVRQTRREHFNKERQNLMEDGNPFRIAARATPEDVLKHLGKGMDLRMRIVLPSEVLSGNPRFLQVDPETNETEILLFSLSGNEFIASEETLRRIAEEGVHAFQWHDIKKLPGIKIETGETIILRY